MWLSSEYGYDPSCRASSERKGSRGTLSRGSGTHYLKRFVSFLLFQWWRLHTFLSGGGWQFMTLRNVLSKLQLSGSAGGQAPTALILDSVPDDKGLKSSLRAVSPTNPVLRVLVFPFLMCLYVSIYIHNRLTGRQPLFDELRMALLQPQILPSVVSGTAPRLYVYSQSDTLVLSERVEQHIAAAAQLGLDVAVEEFEGTGHAAHMQSDPGRYWSAVHSMWMGAVDQLGTMPFH